MSASTPRIVHGLVTAALLLAGCATHSPVAPITQDAGIVNTVIALTAAAAATQTATGIPSATITYTGTPTPTNTPTPSKTPTATPTFLFFFPTNTFTPSPTSTPEIVSGPFYRVRSDATNGRFDDPTRAEVTSLAWPPQVNPAFATTNDTSGTQRTKLSRYGWETYFRWLLSDDDRLFNYATGTGLAMFNTAGWPQMESLLFGNNVVVAETAGLKYGWARIVTMDYKSGPPRPYVSYQTAPWFVQKFTTVNKWGVVGLAPGREVYYPVVSAQNIYIPLDWLEPFPPLPRTEQVVVPDFSVYLAPSLDSTTLGELHADQSLKILRYAPRGSEVWGSIEYKSLIGWVILFNPYASPYYMTTWQMETDPPP